MESVLNQRERGGKERRRGRKGGRKGGERESERERASERASEGGREGGSEGAREREMLRRLSCVARLFWICLKQQKYGSWM